MAKPRKRAADEPRPVWADMSYRLDWSRNLNEDAELKDSYVRVLRHVMDCCNVKDGTGCWKSQANIGAAVGLKDRVVRMALAEGKRRGWITVQPRGGTMTDVIEPAMPARFNGRWPNGQERQQEMSGRVDDRHQRAGQRPSDNSSDRHDRAAHVRHAGAGHDRHADATDSHLKGTRLKGTRQDEEASLTSFAQLPHPDHSATRPNDDWPEGTWRDHEAELLRLLGKQPGTLKDASRWLPEWRRLGLRWPVVQMGVLLSAQRAPKPIRSFSYFDEEVHTQQRRYERCERDHDPTFPGTAAAAFSSEAIQREVEELRRVRRAAHASERPPVVPLRKRSASAPPQEVIDAVAAVTSENFAYAYLSHASWADFPAKTITTATATAFGQLRRDRRAMDALTELAIRAAAPGEASRQCVTTN